MMRWVSFFIFIALLSCTLNATAEIHTTLVTEKIQKKMTPDDAVRRLIAGNDRFIHDNRHKVDFLKKAAMLSQSQHPIAIVLSCIDSRVPPEIIFDQNVGNIFVTRVAANVINNDVLAGMEYATKVTGAKLIVVLGHQSCGAVKGACENVKLGHLSQLLDKIQPAIRKTTQSFGKKDCKNTHFIDQAAEENVQQVIAQIQNESAIIRELVKTGQVKIVGAVYHLKSGKVVFLN